MHLVHRFVHFVVTIPFFHRPLRLEYFLLPDSFDSTAFRHVIVSIPYRFRAFVTPGHQWTLPWSRYSLRPLPCLQQQQHFVVVLALSLQLVE